MWKVKSGEVIFVRLLSHFGWAIFVQIQLPDNGNAGLFCDSIFTFLYDDQLSRGLVHLI